MADGRPSIPRPIAAAVKQEAGHRCAIPTCRGTSALELAHIEPWAKVQEHRFENLILLCAVCHTRFDRGEIDSRSMRSYKANLAILNSRYGEYERRLLRRLWTFEHEAGRRGAVARAPGSSYILFQNVLDDGLVRRPPHLPVGGTIDGQPLIDYYEFTSAGRRFARQWMEAEAID